MGDGTPEFALSLCTFSPDMPACVRTVLTASVFLRRRAECIALGTRVCGYLLNKHKIAHASIRVHAEEKNLPCEA